MIRELVLSSPQRSIFSDAGVYCIPCKDCKLKYIGETSRNLHVRLKEHKRDIRIGNSKNALFRHISQSNHCPVGWGCRIHRLLLCRGVRPPPTNGCPVYDTKQSDGEVPAMLELWGMRSTPLLPLLPGPLWPGVVAPDKGPIYGLNRTIYHASFTLLIFAFKLRIYAKLNCLK